MAEFKIGRLRYNWAGVWNTGVTYSRDSFVQFNGKTYCCLTPHTSTSFVADFDLGYWLLAIKGNGWKHDWTPSTDYDIGSIVRYGPNVYICTLAHTSANSYTLGLEVDLAANRWTLMVEGPRYRGNWQPATRYIQNDIVKDGPNLWIAVVGHTSPSSFDNNINWELWIPGFEVSNNWDAGFTYQLGDIVRYGGYEYVSKTVNNTNNVPTIDAVDWELLTTGYDVKDNWSSSEIYRVGSLVRRHGRIYVAVSDNQSQDPTNNIATTAYTLSGSSGTTLKVASTTGIYVGMIVVGVGFTQKQMVSQIVDSHTLKLGLAPDGTPADGETLNFVGVNGQFWTLVTPASFWTNSWATSTNYIIDDLVVWKNVTYTCVQNHTSSSLTSPELDTNHTYWAFYALHARNNILYQYGQLTVYQNNVRVPLNIGGDTQILRVSGSSPAWATFNNVNNVYYVSTTGTDRVDYGRSWDTPWRSVAYACSLIGAGFQNSNVAYLLTANKEWAVTEMFNWMNLQKINGTSPFTNSSTYDEVKTLRDARLIVDAIVYDLTRGGNSQTVAMASAFFKPESLTTFFSTTVAAEMPYFIAALQQLQSLLLSAATNTAPVYNYQVLNAITNPITQIINLGYSAEVGTVDTITSLMGVIIGSLIDGSTANLPTPSTGVSATIFIKTGTYSETLPIAVPANVALVGDELRGVVIQPKDVVNQIISRSVNNSFIVPSTTGLYDQCPVQFTGTTGGLVPGNTYYVIGSTISGNSFGVSSAPGGSPLPLTTDIGTMYVYGGDALKNMFYVRNASGIRNMTLTGLLGTLSAVDDYLISRPTGGAYVSLDPGTSVTDTRTWITKRSPYIQNVTTFGSGCVGVKIDGNLHAGGNRSIVANDFTQILSDGIGAWCTGPSSLTELISVFCYYTYAGYFAEGGGRIRAANGNSSYGTFGVVAEGYDITETPGTGSVFNRSTQVQASVQQSFGSSSKIVKFFYANAGSGYYTPTTNLLNYSNNMLAGAWTTDGNISVQKNTFAPTGYAEAWTLTGIDGVTGQDYISQTVSVNSPGNTYSNVSGTNITGSGIGATFNIVVTSTTYNVSVNAPGSGYVITNQILIPGAQLGGVTGLNDLTITVTGLIGTTISLVQSAGQVPLNSDLSYTASVYVKQGNASSIDLMAFFSGGTTKTTQLTYNFNTKVLTPYSPDGGFVPINYGATAYSNGWYRLWFMTNDVTAANTSLTYRIYPRGYSGLANTYSYIYGAQLELSGSMSAPSFYLETTNTRYTSYANFEIVGNGSGAVTVGDETRSNAVFQTRVIDPGSGTGGSGYLTASNNAQAGNTSSVTLASSDTNLPANYLGMRLFINNGTGAGQYGFITAFDYVSKIAQVAKESFDTLTINSTTATSNLLTVSSGDLSTLYQNQPVQFIPTYYTTTVTSASLAQATVTAATGGTANTLTVSSTALMTANMKITFTGSVFSTINTGFNYYIKEIIDTNTITITTTPFGTVWPLNTAIGSMTINFPSYTNYLSASTTNMVVNYPISFTGSSIGGVVVGNDYYINDIIDANNFTISTNLITITCTATIASTDLVRPNQLTVDSTSSLRALNPIIFTNVTFGNVNDSQKYYVRSIVDGTHITLATTLVSLTATQTAQTSNLVTVNDTSALVVNAPVKFVGNVFGGIVADTIYYVQAINDSFTFTISTVVNGGAYSLSNASGLMTAIAPADLITQSTASGSMTGTTTNTNLVLTYTPTGSMNGTFSTPLFGGVTSGTTYYINSISAPNITVSAVAGSGTPITLQTKTGSMNLAAMGWDSVNYGVSIVNTLDSSSVYYIEPRLRYADPTFSQATSAIPALVGATWSALGSGNNSWIAMPSTGTVAARYDGVSWTNLVLPTSASWTGITYGAGFWVAISSGGTGKAMYSFTNGLTWTVKSLPSATTWNNVQYGNGTFVAIANGTSASAYSTNYGDTWSSGNNLPVAYWTDLAYGGGRFVAVSNGNGAGTTTAAYSTDGINWNSTTMPLPTPWAAIAFGNNIFVAVSSTSSKTAYSQDGITWSTSNLSIAADSITYGQGVFLAINSSSMLAWTSDNGSDWKSQSISSTNYGLLAYGISNASSGYTGQFVTLAGSAVCSIISAGTRTLARPNVSSGVIASISEWEPGSNYTIAPTLTITDPNATTLAVTNQRIGSGVLASPTFVNRGTGYNTSTTFVTLTGNGYADQFQTGLTLILNNLTRLPQPGDSLTIDGVTTVYKVTSATAMFSTTAPNIEANVQISPEMSAANSPANGTAISLRSKYSQVRLTGHDFLDIGVGGRVQSNYPKIDTNFDKPQNQAVEANYGRVFYVSTDQDGNFKVGNLFGVEQATGIVTLSASQFGLSGLNSLRLGGIAVGGNSVVISQFSTDASFVANSDSIIPTQKAIKTYLANRLTQGGANTFTGLLIAGTVQVGGPNRIGSTVAAGQTGSSVKMANKVNIAGSLAGIDGNLAALEMFLVNANHRTRTF